MLIGPMEKGSSMQMTTSHRPYCPALLRHASYGSGLRHPHEPGVAGPQGREGHHEVHPCPEPGAARASRVRRTTCRGTTKVSYIETIYPPALIAEQSLKFCKCCSYHRTAGDALGRDIAAQRRYEDTIKPLLCF